MTVNGAATAVSAVSAAVGPAVQVGVASVNPVSVSGVTAAHHVVAPFIGPYYFNQSYLGMDQDTQMDYIRKQIEYYFSEENLQKDFFLRRKMDQQGFLPISLIASFYRVQALTQDVQVVIDSIKDSSLIELVHGDAQDGTGTGTGTGTGAGGTGVTGIKVRTRFEPEKWPILDTLSTTGIFNNNNSQLNQEYSDGHGSGHDNQELNYLNDHQASKGHESHSDGQNEAHQGSGGVHKDSRDAHLSDVHHSDVHHSDLHAQESESNAKSYRSVVAGSINQNSKTNSNQIQQQNQLIEDQRFDDESGADGDTEFDNKHDVKRNNKTNDKVKNTNKEMNKKIGQKQGK